MVNYLKRIYTVAEIRTGFVASSSMALGLGYGIYATGEIQWLPSLLLFISAFCFNIVANISSEISGFWRGEDNDYQTGHSGSEGLVRGEATITDAWIGLLFTLAIAIGCGFLALLITKAEILIILGVCGIFVSLFYSFSQFSLNQLPISEFLSGLLCGSFCFLAGATIYLPLTFDTILFSIIPLLLVSFLMATNNTTDYLKDLDTRKTFAHLIGFKNSIYILAPQLILIYIIWIIIAFIYIQSILILIIGLVILSYCGLYKWYLRYLKVSIDTENLSKIYPHCQQ
jgi:1,4-dihydroxy-2-naphthoate octaprenyltransferase